MKYADTHRDTHRRMDGRTDGHREKNTDTPKQWDRRKGDPGRQESITKAKS